MGEHADDLLRHHMRAQPISRGEPKRPAIVRCPDCGKKCRGPGGVMRHQNAKHGAGHTAGAISYAGRRALQETNNVD